MAAGRAERERERCRRRHFVCEGPGWARSRPRPRGGSRGGPAGALSRERSVRPLVGPNGGRCRGATGRVSLSVSGPELTELSRQSPRGSRSDPGRIQWISANMASPAGSSETQKQKRSAVARARGNFSGGNKRERPRARRERCPSGAGEAPAALFTPCKVKTQLFKN
uniref:uncharacterized protein LOC129130870 isoform X2 n=1 Tax=Agelaius phoeniceus TaxID=39638 RepID=UPI0023EB181B|nr:uncharacterized protein LOC129130870 isoform X2 [Agelaius phoeniceus]